MNICFHIILLICIVQVLSHSQQPEHNNKKVVKHSGSQLKRHGPRKYNAKNLANSGKIRVKKLKSPGPRQDIKNNVKKLIKNRKKGKKQQPKNLLYAAPIKDKKISAGASQLVTQKNKKKRNLKIQKSVVKNISPKVQQGKKNQRKRGRKIKPYKNQQKNGLKIKNAYKKIGRPKRLKSLKTANKGLIHAADKNETINQKEIRMQTTTMKVSPIIQNFGNGPPILETAKSLPSEDNKKSLQPPIKQVLATEATITTKEKILDKIDHPLKVPKTITLEDKKQKNDPMTLVANKISVKDKSNQVTDVRTTTEAFIPFLEYHKLDIETTTEQTRVTKKKWSEIDVLKKILTDEEIEIYRKGKTDVPGLCMTHRKIARKLFDRGFDYVHFPSCSDNNLFKPKQCTIKECWCVDVKTGHKVPGPCDAKRKVYVGLKYISKENNYQRIRKREKEREKLFEIQVDRASQALQRACFFYDAKDTCVVFETVLQGAPELPRKIVEAYDGMGKASGDHGQVYQRAYSILNKLRKDSAKCQYMTSRLPFLMPYLQRFSESCEATNEMYWKNLGTDPLLENA